MRDALKGIISILGFLLLGLLLTPLVAGIYDMYMASCQKLLEQLR